MKKNKLIFIFLILLTVYEQVYSSPVVIFESNRITRADTIKVMTYNVHHCNPPGKATIGVIDIKAVSKLIHDQNPDIVALQEVDVNTSRSGKEINEAEEIAKNNGMYFYFGKAIDFGGGGYGVAILSKYPISEMKTILLSKESNPNAEQRVLTTARIKLPGRKDFRFACTHLDVVSEENREMQVKQIIETSMQDSIPIILAGDFNDVEGSKPLQLLDKQFQVSCKACPSTSPQDTPRKAIDFIGFYRKFPFKVISHQVIEELYASDHRPVMAVLSF